jgi:hypothetical protein
MATLTTTRVFEDGEILMEEELDTPLDEIEAIFNTTKLSDENFVDGGIDGGAKLLNGSVTTSVINDSAITSALIEDATVTGANLAANVAGAGLAQDGDGNLLIQVDDATIVIDEVDNALYVPDDAVPTAKLQNGSVTRSKLEERNIEVSEVGTFDGTTLNTWVDKDGAALNAEISTEIQTDGRPVLVSVYPVGGLTSAIDIGYYSLPTVSNSSTYLRVTRDGTSIGGINLDRASASNHLSLIPLTITFLDTPSAGTYTYTLEIKRAAGNNPSINKARIVAVEL